MKYVLIDDARRIIAEGVETFETRPLLVNLHELLVKERELKQKQIMNCADMAEVLSSLNPIPGKKIEVTSIEASLGERPIGDKDPDDLQLKGASQIEVVYRRKWSAFPDPVYSNSREVYKLLLKIWDDGKIDLLEEFKVLFLDTAGHPLGVFPLALGGRSSVIVDPRILFAAALKLGAVSIILAHNHPSQVVTPSRWFKIQDLPSSSLQSLTSSMFSIIL